MNGVSEIVWSCESRRCHLSCTYKGGIQKQQYHYNLDSGRLINAYLVTLLMILIIIEQSVIMLMNSFNFTTLKHLFTGSRGFALVFTQCNLKLVDVQHTSFSMNRGLEGEILTLSETDSQRLPS